MAVTIGELQKCLENATREEFEAIRHSLEGDTRKGVLKTLERCEKRLDAQAAEEQRLTALYHYEEELAASRNAKVIVGLDEVGRGPLAGPLAVGAVVLPRDERIAGLNDSKQVPAALREVLAAEIKQKALAWTVQYIEPAEIDAAGITASLTLAFKRALAAIEEQGLHCDIALLDGNPLRFDPREVNVIKGDARCASIAAASLIAKVDRDALMVAYDKQYPQYHFAQSKGYGSEAHRKALAEHGLSPIHRASFCRAFTQGTLF